LNQFEILVKTIHYYWHILGYKINSDDQIESSLSALFENFPLNINLNTEEESQQHPLTSYYHHPTNTLKLTQQTLDILYTKNQQLKTLFDTRYDNYYKSITKVKAVWEEFNIPILERPILPSLLTNQDMLIVSLVVLTMMTY
jgi:hypothetical protein